MGLTGITLIRLLTSTVIAFAAIVVVQPEEAAASSWVGAGIGTVHAETDDSRVEWEQFGTIYYANNTSSSVALRDTSQYIRLHDHNESAYNFELETEVDGGPGSSYLDNLLINETHVSIGGLYNKRWYYNQSSPSSGEVFQKNDPASGPDVLWVDTVSYDGTAHAATRSITNHTAITGSFSTCYAIGLLDLISSSISSC